MHLYYETGIQSSVISVNRCINHVETFEVFCPIKEKALSQINPITSFSSVGHLRTKFSFVQRISLRAKTRFDSHEIKLIFVENHWTCMKLRLQEETERSKEEHHSLNNTVLFS